jgi:hypothetical protein
MLVSVGGALLLLRLDVNSDNTDVLLALLVFGLGMGFGMSLYTLIVLRLLPRKLRKLKASWQR